MNSRTSMTGMISMILFRIFFMIFLMMLCIILCMILFMIMIMKMINTWDTPHRTGIHIPRGTIFTILAVGIKPCMVALASVIFMNFDRYVLLAFKKSPSTGSQRDILKSSISINWKLLPSSVRPHPSISHLYLEVSWNGHTPKSSGWWFQPLRKILVSWDGYSQYVEK